MKKKYLEKLELAAKRDHRKLGTSLDLFYFDEFLVLSRSVALDKSPGVIFDFQSI